MQENTQAPSSEGKVNDMITSNIFFKLVLKSTIRQSYSDIKEVVFSSFKSFNIHETDISDQSVIFLRDLDKSINKAIMNLEDSFVIRKPCK